MEAIKLSYRILFSLEFSLEGYNDDLNQHLQVVPDKATIEKFPKYRFLPRKQKSASIFLVEVEPDGPEQEVPVNMPKEDELFRFQVKLTGGQFLPRTHLADYDFETQVLVLSNKVNHVVGTQALLSRPVANYNSSRDYKKGYLARSGSGYFMAIQESNAASPHPVTDTAFWKSIPNGSFVNQADLQVRAPSIDLDTIFVLEITHSSSLPAAYQLLDASSKCKEVTYKIKLLHNS